MNAGVYVLDGRLCWSPFRRTGTPVAKRVQA